MLLNDYQAFPWIQEYAYSFAKLIVGEAREKFGQIAGPQGGGTLNGTAMKGEAQSQMDAQIEQLKNYIDGSQPITFVIG
jgi:hypothetical protein